MGPHRGQLRYADQPPARRTRRPESNDGYFLGHDTLLADSAIEQLYGEAGLDLFLTGFTTPADTANDVVGGEIKVGL